MTTTITEAYSRFEDPDRAGLTHRLSPEDWVLPDIDRTDRNEGETTAEALQLSSSGSDATSTLQTKSRTVLPPVHKDKLKIRGSDRAIKLLQQWECVVIDVDEDCVECEMHDLTDDSQPVELAEIYLDEFNLFDRHLLAEGTVFYWSIGREECKTGTIRRYSELRVRRMPPLSNLRKRELAREAEQSSELFEKQCR